MKKAISLLSTMLISLSTAPMIVSAEDSEPVVYEMGDVTHDGVVDAIDATLVLRYYTLSIASPDNTGNNELDDPYFEHIKENGDINCDGKIDTDDASIIHQIYVENSGDTREEYNAYKYLKEHGYVFN